MVLRGILLTTLTATACSTVALEEQTQPYSEPALQVSSCPAPALGKLNFREPCQVRRGDNTLMITGDLLLPDGVMLNGRVLLNSQGVIQCVGCACAAGNATRIDCPGAPISPGLINAHDHIGWMGDAPYVPADANLRYDHRHAWREGDSALHKPKIKTKGNATVAQKIWGELRFVLGGATSTNASGVSKGLLRNLDRASGLEGLQIDPVQYETFPLGDSNGVRHSSGCSYPHIVAEATVTGYHAYTPHVAEGITDAARNELLCLDGTNVGGIDILGPNVAIIHGIGISTADIDKIAAAGAKLIWSPRSNISLYGDTALVTYYAARGVPIALGTDWMPSGSMSLQRELRCASFLNDTYYDKFFTARDLWAMVTTNAALALGVADKLGSIAVAHTGDITIYAPWRGKKFEDPYRAVVEARPSDVALVLRGGKPLAGAANLVNALEAGCDTLDVCGQSKRVCLKREVNKTLTQLQQDVGSSIYGLFYCDTPPHEPSCLPARGSQEVVNHSTTYSGVVTPEDRDGDGIPNSQDNQRHIFNPIRPVDNGVQPRL